MATDTQTRTAVCPTHGTVEATRAIPRRSWPYLVYVVRRMLAAQRPLAQAGTRKHSANCGRCSTKPIRRSIASSAGRLSSTSSKRRRGVAISSMQRG